MLIDAYVGMRAGAQQIVLLGFISIPNKKDVIVFHLQPQHFSKNEVQQHYICALSNHR